MDRRTYILPTEYLFVSDGHFEEIAMVNDLPMEYRHDEMELNAYNAAFYDLGLRWHWDRDTYFELLRRSENSADRIRHYLETRQPHLLKAYDPGFLTEVIEKKALERIRCGPTESMRGNYFDWSQAVGAELGA